MQLLLALIAILCVTMVWLYHSRAGRSPHGGSRGISDSIQEMMTRRDHDVHPAESIDDARLAASGLVVAIATIDGPLSQKEIHALTRQARQVFEVDEREALDILSFGRWIAAECETSEEAVDRLLQRIDALVGPDAGPDLVAMIETVATADGNTLGDAEQNAVATVRRVLRVD